VIAITHPRMFGREVVLRVRVRPGPQLSKGAGLPPSTRSTSGQRNSVPEAVCVADPRTELQSLNPHATVSVSTSPEATLSLRLPEQLQIVHQGRRPCRGCLRYLLSVAVLSR
jgi:hypothetical protein